MTLHDLNQFFEGCHVLGKLDPIIGNSKVRVLSVLLWGLKGLSVVIRGESGSGKTKIGNAVCSLIYGDEGLNAANPDLYLIYEQSDKAGLDKDTEAIIRRAKRCYIPEIQNVKNIEARIKLWTEDRPEIYNRSIRGQRTETFTLKPLPIITSLAEGNEEMPELSTEMQRRIISLPTQSGAKVNEMVHKQKAEIRRKTNDELIVLPMDRQQRLRLHLLSCIDAGERKRVLNPCSTVVREAIPHRYTRSNTFIGYFLDCIEAIALFNQANRVQTDEYIFATPADNVVAVHLAGGIIRDLAIGIPPLGKEVLEFLPMHRHAYGDLEAEDVREATVHIDEVVDYLDTAGLPRPKKIVDILMKKLVGSGFARVNKDGRYYRTQELGNDYKLNHSKLIAEAGDYMRDKWPDLFDEYVSHLDFQSYVDHLSGERTGMNLGIDVEENVVENVVDTNDTSRHSDRSQRTKSEERSERKKGPDLDTYGIYELSFNE